MKVIELIKNFLPSLRKNDVMADIDVTLSELENTVLPCYEQAAVFFNTQKLQSKANLALQTFFYRSFDLKGRTKGKTFVNDINAHLAVLIPNLKYIREELDTIASRDIVPDGLSAKKLTLLRAAENISFLSRYSQDLLILIYYNEVKDGGGELDDDLALAPITIRRIESGIGTFALLLDRLAIKPKDFEKIITKVPDVVVTEENEEALSASYTPSELNPFNGPLLSKFVGNPIYHIRLNIAEWQTSRYKQAKEKKKVLELRLLHLEYLAKGESDPKLEREINYIQGRIDKLDRRIHAEEEKVGGF